MGNRLDEELFRQLKPVAAPAALWDRIVEGEAGCAVAPARWPMWAVAAALAAAIAAFCFTLRSDTHSYVAKFAAGELARGTEDVQFRSGDPIEIRAWVKANAGFDIPLSATARDAQIIGASVFRNGAPMVCVTYRVGTETSRLVVTRATLAAPQHASMAHSRYGRAVLSTWAIEGQTYVLASTTPESGCVLCHVEASRRPHV